MLKLASDFNWRDCFVGAAIIWLLFSVSLKTADSPPGRIHEDFQAFYNAGVRLNQHKPLYDLTAAQNAGPLEFARFQYDYTPTVAMLSQPFARFSADKAFKLWTLTQEALLLASILLFAASTGYESKDKSSFLLLLLTGFRFWPTVCNFDVGQCNIPLLLLICGILACQRASLFERFGVLVGIGAALKYWFMGIAVLLLLQKKWRGVAISVATFTVLTLLEYAIIGFSQLNDFMELNRKILTDTSRIFPTQSVFGLTKTLFSETAYSKPVYHNELLGSVTALLLAVVLVASATILVRRCVWNKQTQMLRYGLVVQTVVMILPACNVVYYVFSLPALWAVVVAPKKFQAVPKLLILVGLGLWMLMTKWLLPITGYFSISYLLWGLSLWLLLAYALCVCAKKTSGRQL